GLRPPATARRGLFRRTGGRFQQWPQNGRTCLDKRHAEQCGSVFPGCESGRQGHKAVRARRTPEPPAAKYLPFAMPESEIKMSAAIISALESHVPEQLYARSEAALGAGLQTVLAAGRANGFAVALRFFCSSLYMSGLNSSRPELLFQDACGRKNIGSLF